MKPPQATLLAATTLLLLTACPAQLPPSVDLAYPFGVRAVVNTDTAVLSSQPGDQSGIDVRSRYVGAPGDVIPKGSVVVRSPQAHPEVSRGTTPTVDPKFNAWIYVEVQKSPVPVLDGASGWVWSPHLTTLEGGASPEPAQLESGLQTGMIKERGKMCTTATLETCPFDISSEMPLRVVGCESGAVKIEVWATTGPYVVAFVDKAAFGGDDPCPAP